MRGWSKPLAVLLAGVVAVLVLAAYSAYNSTRRALGERLNRTSVTHALAVDRVRSVAKLVTSETSIRDVVTYENTRYGSRKRALLVVTGRVLAGFDLDSGDAAVAIDTAARRITVTLPPASVLAVEVVDVTTYDERSGLLNRFTPADRDAIQRQVRARLEQAGRELNLADHAQRSARQLLETMFSVDGFTTEVQFRPSLTVTPSR